MKCERCGSEDVDIIDSMEQFSFGDQGFADGEFVISKCVLRCNNCKHVWWEG